MDRSIHTYSFRPLLAAMVLALLASCGPQDKAMNLSKDTDPKEFDPWVIRTDFSDESLWLKIKDLVSAGQKDGNQEFFAYVKFVSQENHRDKAPSDIVTSLPDNYNRHFCFVVDHDSIVN
ncbi:MAG TPA: hypothetical protein VFB63_04525, partial [Bryobacteraceae bacterium]|nr:hypothetical protein [Bryobacteraceae bacterium]